MLTRAIATSGRISVLSARTDTGSRTVVWLFTATTFTASSLLFLVQPMFAKMVLPRLGGSAAVWTVCVLFFQAALLCGYVYAHASTRWLGVRLQAGLHLALMVSAIAFVPIGIGDAEPPADGSPVGWLLLTMTLRIGLPFFAVATIAPLVQRWLSMVPTSSSANPYFLYAASNVGSLLALLSYPLALEPLAGTITHTRIWTVGYVALLALVAGCVTTVWRHGRPAALGAREAPPGWAARARWVALAAVPSSLMLGVTTHVATDLASIPLLWVLPLAGYLVTFIIAFAGRRPVSVRWVARALPFLALAALTSVVFQWHAPALIPLHYAAFFAAALVCHLALADARPHAASLTEFYVWMSAGGMVGGLFNTLVAPHVFTGVYEYPLVLALSAFARPSPAYRSGGETWSYIAAVALLPVAAMVSLWLAGAAPPGLSLTTVVIAGGLIPAMVLSTTNRTLPFNLLLAAFAVASILGPTRTDTGNVVYAGRSFFGVVRVIEDRSGAFRLLQHGSTLHGRQNLSDATACVPRSYYDRHGPIGQIIAELGKPPGNVAVVGLGTGSLACYVEPESRWTFFEIDPLVERIARDPSLFTFLQHRSERTTVQIRDGRQGLEAAPPGAFDLIVLDAFSSDSVPVHLLTREAIELYRSRLSEDGVLAMHISNRYLDLEPAVAATVGFTGAHGLTNVAERIPSEEEAKGRTPAQWGPVARAGAPILGRLRSRGNWRELRLAHDARPWTDDYSNILYPSACRIEVACCDQSGEKRTW